jgi:hypothetical protein
MIQDLPDLDTLWRPNANNNAINDLALIRTYIGWPATVASLTELIQQLNSVASISPSTVVQVQTWIDEVIELEQTQADEVADGTAHLSNLKEYEGPIQGKTITEDIKTSQLGKIQYDTSLFKNKLVFSDGLRSTPQGQREERIGILTRRIMQACNLQSSFYSSSLIRS